MLKAVMFDFGHTIIDELKEKDVPLVSRSVHLMPGLPEILPRIRLKMGIWANTKAAGEQEVRDWLRRAGISEYFEWITTSEDAGARKPSRSFFSFALKSCGLERNEIIFVGNQLNTDIRGANDYGIACVWLSSHAYHSPDETPKGALDPDLPRPTYTISSLKQLPGLLESLPPIGH
jgi:putative hydrolase of the HAD superfamily